MEQGASLQPQLSLHSDYPLASEHDCIEPFPPQSHHSTYGTTNGFDHLRRDGPLPHPTPAPFTFTSTNNRFVADGGLASDVSSYRTGHNFTHSNSGSISTSPSSAASSLAYNNYPQSHYTSLPTFTSAVPQSQLYLSNAYAGSRTPSVLDGTVSGMPPPPLHFRSPISNASTASDRDSYAHTGHLLARTQLAPNGFSTYLDTPRTVLSGVSVPAHPTAYSQHMASPSSPSYNSNQNESANFPWPNLEVLLDMTCEGKPVTPEVQAKVEKGFFLSTIDQKWTCYRRNYFSVMCNFEIHPNINNARVYLKRNNNAPEQIQAMGMRLSAAVDGSAGKPIELVQHTPKRDNGPKTKIDVVKVAPSPTNGRHDHSLSQHGMYPLTTFHPTGSVPGPYLPLQNANEPNGNSSATGTATSQGTSGYPYASGGPTLPIQGPGVSHTFERVQFKSATANNGKRRASQQYFHLIVELFADVRKDGSETPSWVKVAHRSSEKIVVRGRSPSHYQNEGQNGQPGRGGSTGGGSTYMGSGATYGGSNAGGFRSAAGGYGAGIGSLSGHRHSRHAFLPSSGDSASSPESVEGGALDPESQMDTVMTDSERTGIQEYEGYQYYPNAIYEHVPHVQLPPLQKTESSARYSTEPRQYAVKAEHPDAIPGPQYQAGAHGRFQGFETSRGLFPDLSAGAASYS